MRQAAGQPASNPGALVTAKIVYIGVPYNSDGTPPEIEHPPQALRNAGLLRSLAQSRRVRDWGDVPIPVAENVRSSSTGHLNWQSWKSVTEYVAFAVRRVLSEGGWPLLVGGDCSVLIGAIAGALDAAGPCGLVFLDGHADFRSPDSSATGEAADMELAALTGRVACPCSPTSG